MTSDPKQAVKNTDTRTHAEGNPAANGQKRLTFEQFKETKRGLDWISRLADAYPDDTPEQAESRLHKIYAPNSPVPKPQFYFDSESETLNTDNQGIPVIQTVNIPSAKAMYYILGNVSEKSFGKSFGDAVQCDSTGELIRGDNGKPRYAILRYPVSSRSPHFTVIFEGRIDILAAYQSFEITPGRNLKPMEWSRMFRARVTRANGQTEIRDIPVMQLRQPQNKGLWIDILGIVSGRITDVKDYMLCKLAGFPQHGISVYGQGPAYLPDGSIVYCANSVAFDTSGAIRTDISVDVSGIPEMFRYYDLTNPADISADEIRQGIAELVAAYDEIPAYPEIPAAFLGQLYTASVATIDRACFSAILLTGEKGSGKTYYATRFDSVQSRTLRSDIRRITPALNLGDTTGTLKGTMYAARSYGGFAITTDDVIKSGDSLAHITIQSESASNLVRSFESGGGPRARVDYLTNSVGSAQSVQLQSSVKLTSEKSIVGDSTLERMIVLPHLESPWGQGGIFDTAIAERLSAPESRESQHRAWTALTYWLFQRINTVLYECHKAASDITRTWEVPARIADRYAALITGHYAFELFAAEYDIDVSEPIARAIESLRECAERQAQLSVPLSERFRDILRQAIADGRTAFPGPSPVDTDGATAGTYGSPYLVTEITNDDGSSETIRILPVEPTDLGLIIRGKSWAPKSSAQVYGFIVPPRGNTGKKTPFKKRWVIAIPTGESPNWRNLCHLLTEYGRARGGYTLNPDDVERALTGAQVGLREKIRVGTKHARLNILIDVEWLYGTGE